MVFAKRLREGVVLGEITCSVRIWTSPHVKEGRRYRVGEGEIEIDSITLIGFADITPELARKSGFLGVLDLLKVAKHGKGDNIYLIRFHYIPPRVQRTTRAGKATKVSDATVEVEMRHSIPGGHGKFAAINISGTGSPHLPHLLSRISILLFASRAHG